MMKALLLLLLLSCLVFTTSDFAHASEPFATKTLRTYKDSLDANGSLPSGERALLQKLLDEGHRLCDTDPFSNPCIQYFQPGPRLKIVFQACRVLPGGESVTNWGPCQRELDKFMGEKGLISANVLKRGQFDKSRISVADARRQKSSHELKSAGKPST